MTRESREIWVERVERWQKSGLTAKEFSAKEGLNPQRLKQWKWQLAAERRGLVHTPSIEQPAFVEIMASSGAITSAAGCSEEPTASDGACAAVVEPLEVVLREGLSIRVPVNFNADLLRRVVATLAGAR